MAEALGSQDIILHNAYQVHGNDVVVLHEGPWTKDAKRPEVDALVTDQPGLAIGILTADCAPVLFQGQKNDGSFSYWGRACWMERRCGRYFGEYREGDGFVRRAG